MAMDTLFRKDLKLLEERVSVTQPDLSVIVPTRNEASNIEALLAGIQEAVKDLPVEVIFVDDSTDNTPEVIEASVDHFPAMHVSMIHRQPQERVGGLGGAVVAGLRKAQANYAVVMDGDLQHPPAVVPVLLQTAREKQADLVVATRRDKDSQVTGLSAARDFVSRTLDLIARILFPRQLHGVSDPLTGFFLVRVKALNLEALHPKGFKILMEILVRNPKLRKAEIPFHFGERFAGQSKASPTEVFKYLHLLWNLRFGETSLRFIGFALVGLSGILVNSLILYVVTDILHVYYLVSAAIATVGSSIWNFSLVEAWVYRTVNQSQGRIMRFVMFLLMNTLALSLRGPVIYALTTWLGVYYIISNLISLAILTVLRFVLADNLIWGTPVPANLASQPGMKRKERTMKQAYSYNIHNIVSVVSEGQLPELEPFLVAEDIEDPTITVQIGIPEHQKSGSAKNEHYLHFKELPGPGHIGFEVGIEYNDHVNVVATPLLARSPHVLYTNVVEPILRWTFVKKGYALVHGATIAFGNDAYLITALTDTGKTTTLLKILSHQRRNADQAAFISDDMTIVAPDGNILTYPKPMTISSHTLRAVNSDMLTRKESFALPFQSRIHSRTGRQVAGFITKTKLPAATINMFIQMVIPPPKYYVQKLIPRVKVTSRAKLVRMFVIERGVEEITPIDNDEAIKTVLKNCDDAYGFPPYEQLKEFLYFADGSDLREKEQVIIRQAVYGLPTVRIGSKNLEWWCQIPKIVDEKMARDINCENERAVQPAGIGVTAGK